MVEFANSAAVLGAARLALLTATAEIAPPDAPAAAASVMEVVMQEVWRLRARRTPRRPLGTTPLRDPELVRLATVVGGAAAALDTLRACALLGGLYAALLPQAHRKARGIYYTPPALVDRLLIQAEAAGADWACCTVLDPACGAGALLAPALSRMLAVMPSRSPGEVLASVGSRLRGVDLDPGAAWLAQVLLDMLLLPWTEAAGRQAPIMVACRDGLETQEADDPRPDVIVGNPPYGRPHLNAEQRARFARSLHGRTNLASVFVDHAIATVRPGGVVALVVPTSVLGGEYGKALRATVAANAPPVAIDVVAERTGVFEEALQEAALVTLRRAVAAGPIAVARVSVSHDVATAEQLGTTALPPDPSQPWLLPRRPDQVAVAQASHGMSCRLADWGYRVTTGPVDGAQLAALGTAGRHVPLIWPEAVSAGRLDWLRAKRGRPATIAVQEGSKADARLVRSPCVLLQRTTAPEQPRRLVAVALTAEDLERHGPVAVENHLNIVEPVATGAAVPPEVLAAVLNSEVADLAFRCLGGSVAVSAFELRALPLPGPESLAPLAALVVAGDCPSAINAECARLYLPTSDRASSRPVCLSASATIASCTDHDGIAVNSVPDTDRIASSARHLPSPERVGLWLNAVTLGCCLPGASSTPRRSASPASRTIRAASETRGTSRTRSGVEQRMTRRRDAFYECELTVRVLSRRCSPAHSPGGERSKRQNCRDCWARAQRRHRPYTEAEPLRLFDLGSGLR
jgi:adenine-specific DNA-methyltransferase